VLESARIQARRAGIEIHTGLIRTRNHGASLLEEARRVGADVIHWSTIHAPQESSASGRRRPTCRASPCRVIIETDNRPAQARAAVAI